MKNNNKCNSNYFIIISLLFILLIISLYYNRYRNKENMTNGSSGSIVGLTDKWIYAVTKLNDPVKVYNMFCKDGNLVATVSPTIRKGNSILEYFNWFTSLPNIDVLDKEYSISKVSDNVYMNNAWVRWNWDGLDEPLIARMSFLFRDDCIFQLHSSSLPERPDELSNVYNASSSLF